MKPLVLTCILAVFACSASEPEPLPVPPLVPVAQAPEPQPDPVATVAKRYQEAAQKEVEAVTAPNVTPGYVRAVHQADLTARRALDVLERRPSQKTLIEARTAVGNLAEVLDRSP